MAQRQVPVCAAGCPRRVDNAARPGGVRKPVACEWDAAPPQQGSPAAQEQQLRWPTSGWLSVEARRKTCILSSVLAGSRGILVEACAKLLARLFCNAFSHQSFLQAIFAKRFR